MTFFFSSPFIFPGPHCWASSPALPSTPSFPHHPHARGFNSCVQVPSPGSSERLQRLLAQHPSSSSFWKQHFNFPVRSHFSLTSNPYRVGSADSNPGSKGRHKTWAWPISTFTPMDPEIVKDDTSCDKYSHSRPVTFTLGVLLDLLRSQHSFCWGC